MFREVFRGILSKVSRRVGEGHLEGGPWGFWGVLRGVLRGAIRRVFS